MNKTNELETLLRSWEPRRPAAKVERRLFGARPAWNHARPISIFHVSRLAPVAAAVLLLCTILSQRNERGLSGGLGLDPFMASNAVAGVHPPAGIGIEATGYATQTFDWTNGRSSTSSISSLSASRGTNGS